jgi:hypothetical protein
MPFTKPTQLPAELLLLCPLLELEPDELLSLCFPLESPPEELLPPCPSLEEDETSAELELSTELELRTSEELLNASLEELLPVVPLEQELPPEELLSSVPSGGGLGISKSEEQEKMNVMASTMAAVSVLIFIMLLRFSVCFYLVKPLRTWGRTGLLRYCA